jgi:hypothetical protein
VQGPRPPAFLGLPPEPKGLRNPKDENEIFNFCPRWYALGIGINKQRFGAGKFGVSGKGGGIKIIQTVFGGRSLIVHQNQEMARKICI